MRFVCLNIHNYGNKVRLSPLFSNLKFGVINLSRHQFIFKTRFICRMNNIMKENKKYICSTQIF